MNIALIGNPNTGKTSLFNNLTGSYEYVGNWSGVTVEKKVGLFKNGKDQLIDLPGVYTLNPLSKDEGVVTNFFLNEPFEKLLNILDASQLRRNLHLTMQLLEYGAPVIIGLNMLDVAKNRGIQIDIHKLSESLGVTVAPVVARTGMGCNELAELVTVGVVGTGKNNLVYYGKAIEAGILELENKLAGKTQHPVRWLALQLFEGNPYVKSYLATILHMAELETLVNDVTVSQQQYAVSNKALDQVIHRKRSEAIDKIVSAATTRLDNKKIPLTEKVDMIVTNKFLGIPIFLVLMYVMFMLTFDWLGFPLSDALDSLLSGPVTAGITAALTAVGASSFIKDLILDGIVAGVGGVLVFVPQIFILFFFISLLEDSGYMARVALVMDRLMESVGLNGKAFIPMMIGFGCNVPGIMAARTIETPKERLMTILLTPLMSCSARLPVYALFVGAFFVEKKAAVVLSLYVIGIVIALILAKVFSKTLLKGETSVFVIELPPYRLPQARALWRSTWDKGKGFVKKAGTFIFAGSVLIWLLAYAGPEGVNVGMDDSYLAILGGVFAPLFAPIGFGTWQASASLFTGFLAKEAIISTMNIIYFVPDEASLQGLLAAHYTPLAAYSFMAFILLYIPCLATVATIYKETASKRWTAFSITYALIIAYVLSLIIYQGGKLFGLT
ncbi:ferrous iron transport protein B [Mesobacillus subterraneus]|uniref:ferrous iron transport protein B n=1 Tax=Mesobacillus subterraneus TaxID=285983 RepID=UPI001CFE2251|nr:ferrous iron transport protein B [Mesobacillus subterraneus]WLR57721.1 ferrous iron transport protein B [Mesobacillus subterraneus]